MSSSAMPSITAAGSRGDKVVSFPPWGAPSHVGASSQTATLVSLAQDANEGFRDYMEDGQKVVDPLLTRRGDDRWGFFAVYDGHGGRDEVDYVEKKLHEVVLAELRGLAPGDTDPQRALARAFEKIDGQLAMLGAWNSGCTATVALVRRHQSTGVTLHVANVGDSRAVLVGEGSAKRVSTDHRANDPAEARRVVEEGGVVRHGRVGGQLSVSRSLGDHHLKSVGVSCVPDVCSCEVGVGHALVIASDGLWDALSDDDAGNILQECVRQAVANGGGQQAVNDRLRDSAARTLVSRAKELGSRDNILALVAFL